MALEDWDALKDVPGKNRETKGAAGWPDPSLHRPPNSHTFVAFPDMEPLGISNVQASFS
jgi:hypothetical protein